MKPEDRELLLDLMGAAEGYFECLGQIWSGTEPESLLLSARREQLVDTLAEVVRRANEARP